jgi:hypothetical protein
MNKEDCIWEEDTEVIPPACNLVAAISALELSKRFNPIEDQLL